MAVAEFEEKQYECAFNIELGMVGPVFASGQVLEQFTGYDATAAPGSGAALWRVLGVPRPPGIRLIPSHWSPAVRVARPEASRLPRRPITFVVQFKRPEYLSGPSAAQYRLWNQPYYRFTRTNVQHLQLSRLEKQVAGHATVAYASPAFHRLAELEQAQLRGTVVASTGFVSPVRLGKHKVWTYVQPGVVGRGNPDGEEIEFSLFRQLFEPVQGSSGELASTREDLREHVAILAEACRTVSRSVSRIVDSWIADVRVVAGLPPEMVDAIRDYAVVESLLSRLGATWWLVDGEEMLPSSARA